MRFCHSCTSLAISCSSFLTHEEELSTCSAPGVSFGYYGKGEKEGRGYKDKRKYLVSLADNVGNMWSAFQKLNHSFWLCSVILSGRIREWRNIEVAAPFLVPVKDQVPLPPALLSKNKKAYELEPPWDLPPP